MRSSSLRSFPVGALTVLLAVSAPAQATLVLPAGAATQEQNASDMRPWNAGAPRTQTIYPVVGFDAQGIDHPITITRLRWRANAFTANGTGTFAAAIGLSSTVRTGPNWVWADNRGPDWSQVFTGTVNVPAAAGSNPGQWVVDVPVAPFVFDPYTGRSLLVEVFCSGTGAVALDALTVAFGEGSVYTQTVGAPMATHSSATLPVLELTYTPTFPLLARFTTTAVTGPSPLQVTFTDRSFTTDPNGIQTWQWDFDGDNVIDSTLRHPTFTYTACGTYTVSLTVTDAQTGSRTSVRTDLVQVDPLQASFTATPTLGASPLSVSFTDTSSPTPIIWLWDLDDDGVIDSTVPNPTWTFADGLHPVRLRVVRGCRFESCTRTIAVGRELASPPSSLATGMAIGWILNFDVTVTAPDGIDLIGFDSVALFCCSPAMRLVLLVTPGTYAGVDTDPSKWRTGTSGSTLSGAAISTRIPFDRPLHLAPGSYGIGIGVTGSGSAGFGQLSVVSSAAPFSNADLSVSSGSLRIVPFAGTAASPRSLVGKFLYVRSGVDRTGGYGFFAAGCPTSQGQVWIASQSGWGPRLGALFTTVLDGVPATSPGLFAVTGFDRTTSLLGPLPLNLAPYGLPGCRLHVRDDVVAFYAAASSWSLAIPNAAALLAVPFYQQAVVLDPAVGNPAGAAMSDAASAVIGS